MGIAGGSLGTYSECHSFHIATPEHLRLGHLQTIEVFLAHSAGGCEFRPLCLYLAQAAEGQGSETARKGETNRANSFSQQASFEATSMITALHHSWVQRPCNPTQIPTLSHWGFILQHRNSGWHIRSIFSFLLLYRLRLFFSSAHSRAQQCPQVWSSHVLQGQRGHGGGGRGRVTQPEHHPAGQQETWLPIPTLFSFQSTTLAGHFHSMGCSILTHPMKVGNILQFFLLQNVQGLCPAASNSFQMTAAGSPVTQILKRRWHDHIAGFYCGEGQGLLQKIADLNRAKECHSNTARRLPEVGRKSSQYACAAATFQSSIQTSLISSRLIPSPIDH